VHYLASDVTDNNQSTVGQNYVLPPFYGHLNRRYMPWGGNLQYLGTDPNPYNSALKDPLVYKSDAWNFPNGLSTGQTLSSSWLGQVHRGTPWQTIYLKPTDILASGGITNWTYWTGDANTNDAAAMAPIQDWHLASLLASMFNTNDFRPLLSVNNPDPNAWLVALDGLTALTNEDSGQLDAIIISSNSPQAAILANAVETARSGQPNQFFRDAGDILAVPQLSKASPFLELISPNATTNVITDAAYEMIPGELLSLIRSDSIGSVVTTNNQMIVQFTGYDGHDYAVEVSTNMLDWTSIGTNSPAGGILNFSINPAPASAKQFYRSVLLN
jgi:hypothetical protein